MGAEVWLKSFLTTAPDGGTWLSSRAGRLTPWKEQSYLLNSRLGGSQKDVLEKGKVFAPYEVRNLERPARSLLTTPLA